MARFVLLDAGVVNLVCTKTSSPDATNFADWAEEMLDHDAVLIVPDVTRYEVRRELVRKGASAQLRRLDAFCDGVSSVGVTAQAWEVAGNLWAAVRQAGRTTADPRALDADAILAGVATTIGEPGDRITIATTNVKHLRSFPGIDARIWQAIYPVEVP